MPDQRISEVGVSLGEFFAGVGPYEKAIEKAEGLEAEAAAIRAGAQASYADRWQAAYEGFKELAGVPVEGKPFLLNAINFCNLEVPLRHTSQKPYDKDLVLSIFDTLKPGEPIVNLKGYGVVGGSPRTKVRDYLSGIGISLVVDVHTAAGGVVDQYTAPIVIGVEKRPVSPHLYVGREAIAGYVDGLKFNRVSTRGSHGFGSNRDQLIQARTEVHDLNAAVDLGVDLTALEAEIEKEKRAREYEENRLREYRRGMTPFQRAVTPYGM